jgi:hypothetical protein
MSQMCVLVVLASMFFAFVLVSSSGFVSAGRGGGAFVWL